MKPQTKLLYALAFMKIVLPFFLHHASFQPHRDEFLYLEHARHLDWGYLEVPPLLSAFALISNYLGGGLFWIKIWPALFGALTFLLAGKIVLSLGGRSFALVLTYLPFVLDGYMRLFFLFQPNFLEVFFWTGMAFSIIRYIDTTRNQWLYSFGVCAGLGMMSKYSVAFYIAGILVGLLLSKERRIFLNKHLYMAGLIASAIFLPNLIWQYQHNFPLIHHMQELREQQLQYIDPADFIISQFMMNLPCVFIWIAGIIYITFTSSGRRYVTFAWAWLFVIVLLLALKGKDYYSLGSYPVLFSFGAVYLEKLTSYRWEWLRYAMLIFAFALGLYSLPLVMPLAKPEALISYYQRSGLAATGGFKWEDQQLHPLPQDFADMIGWKELAQKTAAVYKSIPENERKQTLIYCRAYATAGALNYYRQEFGLPEAYSDDSSFLLWMPEKYHIKHLLLVGHQIPDSDDQVFTQFRTFSVKDSVNMPLFRENGIRQILYEDAQPGLDRMIETAVAQMKAEWER